MNVTFTDNKYRVMIGAPRGTSALRGSLERTNSEVGTISATIKDKAVPAEPIRGDEYIPNRTMSWGRRVIMEAGKVVEDKNVTVSNLKYDGDIELLKYGTKGGYPIVLRYLESSPTLDYEFQVKLGAPKYNTEESKETDYMALIMGEQVIDTTIQYNKAVFLKAHHQNADSPYKMPNSEGHGIKEVVMFDTNEKVAKNADSEFEAASLVRSADTFQKLQSLHNIIGHGEIEYDESDQNALFDALKIYAKQEPVKVLSQYASYKANVSNIFEKFKAFDAIDLGKANMIVITRPEKVVILDGVFPKDMKGDKLLDWVMQNLLRPEVETAIQELERYSLKLS